MAVTANNLNCVVVSVDYRKGPEVRCPQGQRDFVDALNHVLDNSSKFNIDPKKICIAGTSGGAWIVTGAANILGKSGKLGKVKALFIHSGMLSDETRDIPTNELHPHERDWGQHASTMTTVYKLHATDFENQKQDDQLYPGKVSYEILKAYPPTVIWTSEYDIYKRDNEKFAERLKREGKLQDISIMPGVMHGYHCHNF